MMAKEIQLLRSTISSLTKVVSFSRKIKNSEIIISSASPWETVHMERLEDVRIIGVML